ncbi:MAG: carbamoyltransferase HypF [Candidatus Omnitrophota bacterium]|nr:MAG: carbamoyltransferase HypF [Candidatus Omnitrophota bacterium]
MRERLKLHINGIVQGVGFRPYIYNLSRKFQLDGFVFNDPKGVVIEIEGARVRIEHFLRELKESSPAVSFIDTIRKERIVPRGERGFLIKESIVAREKFVFISHDLSVCGDCLRELFERKNRRYLYPFINCTNCGPRFTIIEDVPYDRPHTTMRGFKMCSLCTNEYHNPSARRFHAQPNACLQCGPGMNLFSSKEGLRGRFRFLQDTQDVIERAAQLIIKGKIIAIKGVGGYHLACDAKNTEVVRLLRKRKERPTKPFALMVDNYKLLGQYCVLKRGEREIFCNPRRPIVLLRIRKKAHWMEAVAPHQEYLGVMCAYAPHHYLLLSALRKYQKEPILVMTSANRKDYPLVHREQELKQLRHCVDYFLIHNRPIHMRCDDSIVRVFRKREIIVRKARGYTPDYVELPSLKEPLLKASVDKIKILGCGAELKNTFSILKDNYIITSPYIGDLKNYHNYEFFLNTLSCYRKVFGFHPEVVAYDFHPDYLSTQYAHSLECKRKVGIQHHHAHIAACMVDNALAEKVIGVCFDGAGYGLDQKIWGGEFFIADRKSFLRAGHFKYFGLIGAHKAIEEPARVALYLLYDFLRDNLFDLDLHFLRHFKKEELDIFLKLIRQRHLLLTSSAGRLFDAAASILNLKHKISYEAEAAILLEMYASHFKGRRESFGFTIGKEKGIYCIDWQPLFSDMIKDIQIGKSASFIAHKFHFTFARLIKEMVKKLRKDFGIKKVVLSGGVFQNALLLKETVKLLEEVKFSVYYHSRFPTNDAGVSVGQVVVASENIT